LPPASVITVDTENNAYYVTDTADLTQFAKQPGPVLPTSGPGPAPTFTRVTMIGDIVTVNGIPVKGTVAHSYTVINLTPNPGPGQSIADTSAFALSTVISLEILLADGTRIGSLTASGVSPPGAPFTAGSGAWSITGGTGAFLGVRGELLQSKVPNIFGRAASVTEDPSTRRSHPGGTSHFVLHLIPLASPEVLRNGHRPVIVHADNFREVSPANPAHSGETLILLASGLGPTRPGVDPGEPFTADPVQVVNAPVEVFLESHAAEVLSAIGISGTENQYQVSFRVPADTPAGVARLKLRTAWMQGHTVPLSVQ
jgi:hypothetical protein